MGKYIALILTMTFTGGYLIGQENSVLSKVAERVTISGDVQFRYEQALTDSVNVRGRFAADPVESNFAIRRSRVRFDAQVTKRFSATVRLALQEFQGNASGRVLDYAYFDYKISPVLKLRAGQFKSPFGMEELHSSNDLPVIDRGLITDIFGDNEYMAIQTGVQLEAKWKDQLPLPLNIYAGIFNGNGRNQRLDNNTGKNIAARAEIFPISWLQVGGNAQWADLKGDEDAMAYGADIFIDEYITEKAGIWIMAEYLYGNNIEAFGTDTFLLPEIANYTMQGWYTTILFKYKPAVKWLKEIEIGGKYEVMDPVNKIGSNGITQITPNIGLVFAEENAARWQFNLIRTIYEKELDGALKDNWLFVTQFQVRF